MSTKDVDAVVDNHVDERAMPRQYQSILHIAQSIGRTIRAISPRYIFLAEALMRRELRLRTTLKVLYGQAYRSVQSDRRCETRVTSRASETV